METFWVETLGVVAGIFTTAAYVPQVMRTMRTRSVGDISFHMYAILALGISLWVVYGILMRSVAVILANSVTMVLIVAMMVMKIRYGGRVREKK